MKKSKETYNRIIEAVELGTTLTQVCKLKDNPSLTTVHTWMKQDQKFKEQLLDARRIGAMVWLDKMQDMVMDDVEPTKVQLLRERLHHSRWVASKLISIFGDKQTVENIGEPIIKVIWDDGSLERKQSGLAHASKSSSNEDDKEHDNKSIN